MVKVFGFQYISFDDDYKDSETYVLKPHFFKTEKKRNIALLKDMKETLETHIKDCELYNDVGEFAEYFEFDENGEFIKLKNCSFDVLNKMHKQFARGDYVDYKFIWETYDIDLE